MRMNTEQMFDFLDANGHHEIIDYIQLLSDKISVLERENALLRQGMDDAFVAAESLLEWTKARRGIVNEIKSFDEEEFNKVAYSYRSWPASDPVGVASRYRDLLDFVTKEAN
jgi:hypothetical protein